MSKLNEMSAKEIPKFQYYYNFSLTFSYGLLDVLNKHFQNVFGISKLQSTSLQVMYFSAYLIFGPVSSLIMSRFGYKKGIFLGLGLFAFGALMFWPSAHFEKFGGFLGATWIIGCGLSTLEVAANSYISVLGPPSSAAFRLNFAQSWNGLALFIGPLIASKYFFSGPNAGSLVTVQYVYLSVACLALLIGIFFFFASLPEISEEVLEAELLESGLESKSFFANRHLLLGFAAQMCYMAAQVSTAAFVINRLTDGGRYTDSEASSLFAYMQICFLIARFVSTPLLKFMDATTLLFLWGSGLSIFTFVAAGSEAAVLPALFLVFFFESVCYPLIFVLATSRLGRWTKRGGGLLVAAVFGGAWCPPIQGAIADAHGTQISFLIPAILWLAVPAYAVYMRFDNARASKQGNMKGGTQAVSDDEEKDLKPVTSIREDIESEKEKGKAVEKLL